MRLHSSATVYGLPLKLAWKQSACGPSVHAVVLSWVTEADCFLAAPDFPHRVPQCAGGPLPQRPPPTPVSQVRRRACFPSVRGASIPPRTQRYARAPVCVGPSRSFWPAFTGTGAQSGRSAPNGAGERDHRAGFEIQIAAHQSHFERRRIFRVAHQQVFRRAGPADRRPEAEMPR